MTAESDVVQYIINGGGVVLVLYVVVKKLEEVKLSVERLNNTIMQILTEALKK